MNVLVTGATGFLAKNLIPYLRSQKYEVYGTSRQHDVGKGIFKCNLKDYNQVKKVLDTVLPNYIIHLAGNSTGKPPESNRWDLFESNVLTTMNLLDWSRNTDYYPYFIFASSVVIYKPTMSTFGPNSNGEIFPKSLYGVTKASCEMLINSYHTESHYTLPYTNIRIPALTGPGLTHGVIKIFIERLLKEKKFSALGIKPGAIKPYVHSYDVCNIINKIMKYYETGEYFKKINLSNNPISMEQVAHVIMEVLGINKEIEWINQTWPTDNNYLAAKNSEYIFDKLDFELKYSSEEAIRKTVESYLNELEK